MFIAGKVQRPCQQWAVKEVQTHGDSAQESEQQQQQEKTNNKVAWNYIMPRHSITFYVVRGFVKAIGMRFMRTACVGDDD